MTAAIFIGAAVLVIAYRALRSRVRGRRRRRDFLLLL